MSEALHLAAPALPLPVFIAMQAAVEAGAAMKVWVPGKEYRYDRGGVDVRAYLDKGAQPESVAILKAAGFVWRGNCWAWEEWRTR